MSDKSVKIDSSPVLLHVHWTVDFIPVSVMEPIDGDYLVSYLVETLYTTRVILLPLDENQERSLHPSDIVKGPDRVGGRNLTDLNGGPVKIQLETFDHDGCLDRYWKKISVGEGT